MEQVRRSSGEEERGGGRYLKEGKKSRPELFEG
jgi:hypothetical protein